MEQTIELVGFGFLAVSTIMGWVRGVARETLAILGWILSAIFAFRFAGNFQPVVPELPVIGPLVSTCQSSAVAAFLLLFLSFVLIVALVAPILSEAIKNTILGPLDKMLGAAFGLLRAFALFAAAYLIFNAFVPEESEEYQFVRSSTIYALAEVSTDILLPLIPDEIPDWEKEYVDKLLGNCTEQQETNRGLFNDNHTVTVSNI